MAEVSIRKLRNHAGEVVERARRGERVTITRAGLPVAQLVTLQQTPVSLDELRRRRAQLPAIDPTGLRNDIDGLAVAEVPHPDH